jgi:hypothetical protein
MLMDPRFFYKVEGASSDAKLNAWDLANRLAYFIWKTGPDEALLAKAQDGSLLKADARRAEVERMLDDPKAEKAFRDFIKEWLILGNIDNLQIPNMTIDKAGLREAVLQAAVEQMFKSKADVRKAFGLNSQTSILTMPGVLGGLNVTPLTSPVKRGLYFSGRILCRKVPPPPANAGAFKVENAAETVTPRERLKKHEDNATCAFCHASVDPIGLALESFDAIGATRDKYDNKIAIDTAGSIRLGTETVKFQTTQEMLDAMAASDDIAACLGVTTMEYALGAAPDSVNSCELSRMHNEFQKSGYKWRDLIQAITSSTSFLRGVNK